MDKPDNKAVKKPDVPKEKRSTTSMDKPEPIQLPPSFKEPIYGKVSLTLLIFRMICVLVVQILTYKNGQAGE